MAFVKIDKGRHGPQMDIADEEIRMGLHLQNTKDKTRTIYFAITPKTVVKAGWEVKHTENGRIWLQVDIMEGTRDDAGFLMMMPSNGGYTLGTNKAKGASSMNSSLTCHMTLGKLKHYVPNIAANGVTEVPPTPVEFTYQDGGVLIQCPDWLRYNPQSVPEPEPVVKKEASPPPRPTKKLVQETVDEIGKGDDNILQLNRSARRRLASKVAQQLGKR